MKQGQGKAQHERKGERNCKRLSASERARRTGPRRPERRCGPGPRATAAMREGTAPRPPKRPSAAPRGMYRPGPGRRPQHVAIGP